MKVTLQNLKTAFGDGVQQAIDAAVEDAIDLYKSDDKPWVIGYSGGKDSTAILQLVWTAISTLDKAERTKPVHVISTDTLVENPIVAQWVGHSLDIMKTSAAEQELPIIPHKLTPTVEDSFWVNLIGRGYPAPRHKFRWCTSRIKINPSNHFITNIVQEHGEAILVLGTRKAESASRSKTMSNKETNKYHKTRIRDKISPNASLPNALVYTPIETWSNDDVWLYLMQFKNPWGYNNKDLLAMYSGATDGGECPLVVDTSTPSCGDSRFGCWVCTLVDQDKSMAAMVQNDQEKEWMLPLLKFRNKLDFRTGERGEALEKKENDRHLRDFRRMSGNTQVFMGRLIHGPYKQSARENFLTELLKAQEHVRKKGPPEVRDIELITMNELEEIRRVWVIEKHEIEDSLPRIYKKATGRDLPLPALDENLPFGEDEINTLRETCGEDNLQYELIRDCIDIERRYSTMLKRAGLFSELESAIQRNFYTDEQDAEEMALRRSEAKKGEQEEFDDYIDRFKSGNTSVVKNTTENGKEVAQ